MKRKCLYCAAEGEGNFLPSYLPDTLFLGKLFASIRCRACGLVQLHPSLSPEDLLALYPPSYQGNGVNLAPAPATQRRAPFGAHFAYSRHFGLLKKHAPAGPILDFGCGDGNFVANAAAGGFACHGVEYDLAQVKLLREAMPAARFFAYGEFAAMPPKRVYAAIRLSNVLEHLTEPREQLTMLARWLASGGVFLIEGPLEENSNLAFLVRRAYFWARKALQPGWRATHAPFHVSFAGARNQLGFFSSLGFETLHFETGEGEWPFPKCLAEARSAPGLVKFFLARASMALSSLVPGWGNAFLCVEKPNS